MAAEAFGDPIDLFERKAQGLADLARRRPCAVGDDIGGHGGAVRPVALVDVLDDLFALVAGGQVEIDVGPLAALLGQEALEQELHLDRVDGGDGEGVADRRVGGRAAALGHDVLPLAEADDVPDDEEIARQIELLDQIEFAFQLRLGAGGERSKAGAGAVPGHPAEVRDGAFAHRQRVVGEAVAEVRQGELELVHQGPGLGHRPRLVGKEERHLARRSQVAFAAALEQSAGGVQGRALADAGEDIGEIAVGRFRIAGAAGGQQRQPQAPSEIDERPVAVFLVAQAVALQFHVQPSREESA